MKKLGFGMMRLPLPDPKFPDQVNMDAVYPMVDAFIQRGYTYFDTAYMYHGGKSELFVREAVVNRHDRSTFTLADKMPLFYMRQNNMTKEDQAKIFDEQLEKCGVEYFDYYLLHNVTKDNYLKATELDTFAFLLQKKAEGKIRHLGFSFHDTAEMLDKVLTEHPEVEFVQIQLNYLDWEDERIQSRKCYETIVKHGKYVVVMEPVKGGKLATVPAEVAEKMTAMHPDWTPASWAIRFAASLPAVKTVLSGMSNQAQLDDNTGFMAEFTPLNEEELKLLAEAADTISKLPAIDCTACHYCEDGCPHSIAIPAYFALYNQDQLALRSGLPANKAEYEKLSEGHGKASLCVSCGQCESACPQHLPIMASLKKIASTYE